VQVAGAECAPKLSIKRLGHVGNLARAVRVGDHYGASPYAAVSEVDDLGLDSAERLADLLSAVPWRTGVLNGSSGKSTSTRNFMTSPPGQQQC
jgi:hypothetical protein